MKDREVCLFDKCHINLHGVFNAEAIYVEEQLWYYLTQSWEYKGFHTHPLVTSLKENVLARLEFELAYFAPAVLHFNNYAMETSRRNLLKFFLQKTDHSTRLQIRNYEKESKFLQYFSNLFASFFKLQQKQPSIRS